MESQDLVLVGTTDKTVFICVEGRGNFQNSHPLKEYALGMMAQGRHHFVVNLEKCVAMDSTFMGVLAGLAIQLKKNHHAALKVVNLSPHNRELLETLGLLTLLELADPSAASLPSADPLKKTTADKTAIAKHMLEAHETLSQMSDMNQVKFKNVIQYLQEDLKRKQT